jgi:hypothetical protein
MDAITEDVGLPAAIDAQPVVRAAAGAGGGIPRGRVL